MYLNFSAPIADALLQRLCKSLVEVNSVNVVCKVFDQFLGFVSLEPDMFTLNMAGSFARYNNPNLIDTQVESCIEEIAQGAVSVAATLGLCM